MVQIICCRCTQQQLRDAGVDFHKEQNFYQDVKNVFVAPCSTHPMFKDRFRNVEVDICCKYLQQQTERCSDCKKSCFTLNFVAYKVKALDLSVVPETLQLKTVDNYLKKNIKSMLFFHFCRNFMKIGYSLDNPDKFHLIKGKKLWESIFFSVKNMIKILTCHCK